MRQERHVNNTFSTLDVGGPLGSGVTVFDVADGSGFPSEGDFRVLVENELMLVTARSGATLTAVRGIEDTIAAEHPDGSTVRVIVTEGALEKHMSDFNALYIPNGTPPFRLFKADGSPATRTDFAWFNQGSASAEDLADGSILLTTPGGAGNNACGKYVAPPTPPYTLTAAFSMLWLHSGSSYPQCGIMLEESGTGRLIGFTIHHGRANAFVPGIEVAKYNSYTSFNSDYFGAYGLGVLSEAVWLRIADDSVNLTFSMSIDGVKWRQLHQVSRIDWLVSGANRISFAHDRASNNVGDHLTYLKHWSFA